MKEVVKARLYRWGPIGILSCMFSVIVSVLVAGFMVNDPSVFPLGVPVALATGCLLLVFLSTGVESG
jgi:hypothetical protein